MGARITSPASILAVIPAITGTEPAGTLVILGTTGTEPRAVITIDLDLIPLMASRTREALTASGATTAVITAYAPETAATPAVAAIRGYLDGAGIPVLEALRAEAGRYWSYVCTEPECCPPQGTPYDPGGHPAAVTASRDGITVTTITTGTAASRG